MIAIALGECKFSYASYDWGKKNASKTHVLNSSRLRGDIKWYISSTLYILASLVSLGTWNWKSIIFMKVPNIFHIRDIFGIQDNAKKKKKKGHIWKKQIILSIILKKIHPR